MPPSQLLWAGVLCLLLCVGPSEAIRNSIVCVCRCCYLGDCHPIAKGTFPIDTCAECTKEKCEQHAANTTTAVCPTGAEASYLKSECYNRNAFFPKLTCFILLGLLTGLVVFGVAKDHIPMLTAYSAKHFNY